MKYTAMHADLLNIPQSTGNCLLDTSSIVRVEARSNYCRIYFMDERKALVVSKVLGWVAYRLPADMFVRVHRSHLVNRCFIQQVSGNAAKIIELTNGDCVPVSRRRQAVLE